MNLRRAGLAVLAATALTLTPSTTASAVPSPPAAHSTPAGPVGLAGPVGVHGWPLPVPDLGGLLPGLYAVNVAGSDCLTAPAGGGPASARRCEIDDAYRWKLVPASLDGRFRVQNDAGGRCLVPAGAFGLAAGPCGDAVAGTWRLKDAPGTGIYVINAASGRCLTVSPHGAAVQSRCDGAVARRWTFRLTPTGKGVVVVNGGKP